MILVHGVLPLQADGQLLLGGGLRHLQDAALELRRRPLRLYQVLQPVKELVGHLLQLDLPLGIEHVLDLAAIKFQKNHHAQQDHTGKNAENVP